SCWSEPLGYPCCKGCEIVDSDDSGSWGVEKNNWCGIDTALCGGKKATCFSLAQGYPCCKGCEVAYTDESGPWGVENNDWCGITDGC
ncbi:Non-catalytic module family DOC2, partial [Piromyces sp. E2]